MTRRAAASRDLRLHRVRDVLLEQLEHAARRLRRNGKSDSAVHDIRKELKCARGALRLLRKPIGDAAFRRDNLAIRDAARPLAPLRDARVLLRTLGRLRNADGDNESQVIIALTRQFQEERRTVRRRLLRKQLVEAADTLQGVTERISKIPQAQLDETTIAQGVGRVYKTGRRTFGRVRDKPTDARLHEWRKQVKYLLGQIDVARRLGATKLKRRRKYSHQLAEVLGENHDLAVLNAKMTAFAVRGAGHRFAPRIEQRRHVLQLEAHHLGKLLYGKKARRLKSDLKEQQSPHS
jgi:hypothetical protein